MAFLVDRFTSHTTIREEFSGGRVKMENKANIYTPADGVLPSWCFTRLLYSGGTLTFTTLDRPFG